jgi:hypothetical protein
MDAWWVVFGLVVCWVLTLITFIASCVYAPELKDKQ